MSRTPPPALLRRRDRVEATETNIRRLRQLADIGLEQARALKTRPMNTPADALSIATDLKRIAKAVCDAIEMKVRLKRRMRVGRGLAQLARLRNWEPSGKSH